MEIEPEKYIRMIAPPPVVLVSTLYKKTKNVAPMGMNMPVSSHPPLLALGIRETRDTVKNIKDTGEFVVGIPGPNLVKEIDITGEKYPRDVSEFEKAGLTPVKSRIVKPFRIGECQVNLECKLEWLKQAGDHHIIVGRVVAAEIKNEIYRTGTRGDLDPVYHVASRVYARRGPIIKNP